MSQLAPAQQVKPLTNGAEWWSLTIQPTDAELCDAVLGDVVIPLAAQGRSWGAQRWFHTRCMDPAHPFIQVRILGSPRVLDRLESLMRALVDQAAPRLGDLQTSEYREDAIPTRWDYGPVSARAESDLAKYGGAEGLALAEEVFELSSDLAAWATSRFPKANSRSSLAALLLFDASYAMMRGPRSPVWADRRAISWDYYWDSHLRSCTAGFGPRAASVRQAMTVQVGAKVMPTHRLMAATAAESAVENWRRRWFRTMDTYLYRADKARVSRSAQHLTVYQAHMLLNRLGLSLREEAAMGLYARTWSTEREAMLLDKH